jgi:cell division protein FtsI/penicillin-binding protein 2
VTGREVRFRLVAAVQEPGQPEVAVPPFAGRRIVSDATVLWMRQTLARVVTDPPGTAHRHISGPGVDGVIGGKTGTSFVSTPQGRVSTASFVGFAPVHSPRWLAMAVLQKDNVHSYYGGQFAAPIVRDLLLHVMRRIELRERAAADTAALVSAR